MGQIVRGSIKVPIHQKLFLFNSQLINAYEVIIVSFFLAATEVEGAIAEDGVRPTQGSSVRNGDMDVGGAVRRQRGLLLLHFTLFLIPTL